MGACSHLATARERLKMRMSILKSVVEATSHVGACSHLATARERLKTRVSVLKSVVEAVVGAIINRPQTLINRQTSNWRVLPAPTKINLQIVESCRGEGLTPWSLVISRKR